MDWKTSPAVCWGARVFGLPGFDSSRGAVHVDIDELRAREEIRQRMSEYAYHNDNMDAEKFAAVFAETLRELEAAAAHAADCGRALRLHQI